MNDAQALAKTQDACFSAVLILTLLCFACGVVFSPDLGMVFSSFLGLAVFILAIVLIAKGALLRGLISLFIMPALALVGYLLLTSSNPETLRVDAPVSPALRSESGDMDVISVTGGKQDVLKAWRAEQDALKAQREAEAQRMEQEARAEQERERLREMLPSMQAAMEGHTLAEIQNTHGPALSRDAATGWATWAKFKARFVGGRVVEVALP